LIHEAVHPAGAATIHHWINDALAEALQRLEAGSLGFDEARAVAEMAQAYVAVKNVAGLEQRSAEMLAEIESLRAEIARLTGGSR